MNLANNPHASPLATRILDSWGFMLERFHSEARDGLSYRQVAKHLGAREFNGQARPLPYRRADYLPIVRSLAWLARRGYLTRIEAPKGVRYQYVGTPPASNHPMNRQELIAAIHQSLEQGRLENARRLAGEARVAGINDVADRAFAAIEKATPRAPKITGVVPTELREGLYTVEDETSHVTFRVEKQGEDEKFAPGEVIIGRLIGSNNEQDYKGVAFWKADGRVILWKKHRGDARLEAALRVLVGDPKAAALRYAQESGRCYVCNRTLTTPESIRDGIGPVCKEKGY